ncbi:unnamed protein product [Camellia sinensis]
MALLFCLNLQKLDETVTVEYRDLPEPVQLPGCVPIQGKDLPEPVQDRSANAYKKLISNVKQFRSAEGIIVNSFVDMKDEAIKALQAEEPDKPPVHPIGLVIQVDSSDGLD